MWKLILMLEFNNGKEIIGNVKYDHSCIKVVHKENRSYPCKLGHKGDNWNINIWMASISQAKAKYWNPSTCNV